MCIKLFQKKKMDNISRKSKFKIQLCITVLGILNGLFISMIIIMMIDNGIFEFGPSQNLSVLGLKLNTWRRYIVFLSVVFIYEAICQVCDEFGTPILGFSIYNPDRVVINEFTSRQLYLYSNLMFGLLSLKYVISTIVIVSRLDITLCVVVSRQIATLFTTSKLIKQKTFLSNSTHNSDNDIILVENEKIERTIDPIPNTNNNNNTNKNSYIWDSDD